MKEVVVHVGYPKAASSTLQKHLFSKHSEIDYYGNYPTNNVGLDTGSPDRNARYLVDANLRRLYVEMLKRNRERYDQARTKELLMRVVSDTNSSGRLPVLSHERFLSVLFWYHNIEEKACRLKELLPNARILIVVRNQKKMIVSQYRNHPFDPRNIATGRAMSFSEWFHTALIHDNEIGYLRSLRFAETVRMYEVMFGKGNVKVLCAEDLSSNVLLFAKELSEFMLIGQDEAAGVLFGQLENAGVPSYIGRIRRYINSGVRVGRVVRHIPLGAAARVLQYVERWTGKVDISRSDQQLLCSYFSESNNNLAEYLGSRVQDYSYPL